MQYPCGDRGGGSGSNQICYLRLPRSESHRMSTAYWWDAGEDGGSEETCGNW
jgi:hypothetical protein